MEKSILIFLLAIFVSACTSEKEGDWDDNIKLSQKKFSIDALQNVAIITTEGDSWWVSGISFEGGQLFDYSDVDTTSKNFTITETEFVLERKNGKEISIEISKNTTNAERILNVELQAGNYFDVITIVQSPD